MNRTIKFRVWDKINKQFRDPEFMGGHLNDIFLPDEMYVFQQFTGLFDKNGKEIYEGDVIKFKERNYEVSFYEAHPCFMFLPTDIGPNTMEFFCTTNFFDFIPQISQSEKYQIIGNIFENSDLLN